MLLIDLITCFKAEPNSMQLIGQKFTRCFVTSAAAAVSVLAMMRMFTSADRTCLATGVVEDCRLFIHISFIHCVHCVCLYYIITMIRVLYGFQFLMYVFIKFVGRKQILSQQINLLFSYF